MSPFLKSVHEASGLCHLFSTDCIVRACGKIGLTLGDLTPEHMPALAEALRPTLRLYLGRQGAAEAIAALMELCGFEPSGEAPP